MNDLFCIRSSQGQGFFSSANEMTLSDVFFNPEHALSPLLIDSVIVCP